MSLSTRQILALSFAIAAAGFLLPLWPLSVVGILIAALSGRFFFAIVMGLLLDVAWGMPVGLLHYVYFPFTALAFGAVLARIFGGRYFIDRTPPGTL
jgi:hypothetical protein